MSRDKNGFDGLMGESKRIDFAVDADVISRAESVVASLGEEYLQWLSEDLDRLDSQLTEARTSPRIVDQLRRKAHDIRGQGGSFGYPLISELADALHSIMAAQASGLAADDEDLSRELFVTMRMVVDRKALGDGDEETRASVSAIVNRVAAVHGGG